MQFTYHTDASMNILEVESDTYKYLIKARRHKIDDVIAFRNLKDDFIYNYKISSIDRKKAFLELISKEKKVVENSKKLHIGWCIVDPKTIEKTLPSLNELGVYKITFIYCEFSQKNFKLNFEKLEKILINSSSQCGRSSIIKLETCNLLDNFLQKYSNSYVLDFSENLIDDNKDKIETFILGCEGGFSFNERGKFNKDKIVGFNSNLILKSETAIISAASKILI